MRRVTRLLAPAATAAWVLLMAAPVLAAGATVQQPAGGATVSSPVTVRVSVSRDITEDVGSVVVRLSRDGATAAADTRPADLTCVDGCGPTSTQQVWGGVTLDPAAPSRFGSATPLENGAWYVQPSVNGGSFASGSQILVSYAGSPVSGLSAAADGLEVSLSWRRAPEPDVAGYHVERRGSGAWTGVARLGPNASSYRDTVPSSGDWSYRVITERPDGRGGTYTTESITVGVATDDPSVPNDRDAGAGGGDSSEPTGDPGTADGSRAAGEGATARDDTDSDGRTSPAAGTSGGDGDSAGPRTSRTGRVAPPPSVRRSAGVRAQADAPSVAAPRQRYYGEDDGYSDELDYADAPVVAGEEAGPEPDAAGGTDRGAIAMAVEEFVVARLNSRSILVPVAAGLLLVTLGLHIYRWMRAT